MKKINQKAISKAPDSDVSEWIKQAELLMHGFKQLPESENKQALTSAISKISVNLNELKTNEMKLNN